MIETPALREAVAEELALIRAGFRLARSTGLWRSPYPQSQWSACLGCEVRESLPDDPGLTVTPRPATRPSVHGTGSAIPAPCVVWVR